MWGLGGDGIGSATIDGTGSSWINSADLYVGNNGNGTLNILNGGLVTSVAGAVGAELQWGRRRDGRWRRFDLDQ